jgi:flavin reductase (DIM6/NTAB) family NADH-FMN oxidoreductase RutF
MATNLTLVADTSPALAPHAAFLEAMSTLASGVVVVTCRVDGRPWGTTVTAFASVAVEPPTVLVSLASGTVAAHAIAATGRFGVNVLAEADVAVARHCAARGAPKFLEPFVEPGDARRPSPALANALAHLDCEVYDEVDAADHTVFFGRVRTACATPGGEPLVRHRRTYRTLATPEPTPLMKRSERWPSN